MTKEYDFRTIEKKWQKAWDEQETFRAREDSPGKKYYCLEMYPYPSGRIHMGHVRNYSIGDVISRFMGMRGFNVLHPIGWDALGMPAENAAITQKIHPQKWTLDNIAHMKRQLKRLGYSYDWTREVNTCLPEYYEWNQWIFLKLFEKGQAYRRKSLVNWCPLCRTVLANEQVVADKCWRCDSEVIQKNMEQWFLKITDYAEELLTGHDLLKNWPEHVLTMQKNWIGKSTGAHIIFPVENSSEGIEVFTTRIDTIFGATFVVLSPEHPLSREFIKQSEKKDEMHKWLDKAIMDRHLRKDLGEAEKEGIDAGKRAINPFTGEKIPIWIANYVLMEYGTGAIMAVPGHDTRDFEFAKKYGLEIKEVIVPEGEKPRGEIEEAFEGYGRVVNSGDFSGLPCQEAMEKMASYADEKKFGRKSTIYRLKDWGISRQRYWGTPIPVIYCDKCGIVGVPYKDLPVTLPQEVQFKGEEGSPLEKSEKFVQTECPKCGGKARRETDTMDTFFDSSWYYFRYCSPGETRFPFDPDAAKHWLPVDLYIGGVEHAILHLIYARFFCKILRDFGLGAVDEPFPHYLAQGMVTKDGAAMSKSKGNVVDPDEIITRFGADTLRLFVIFASPPEKEFAWNEKGIEGSFRFLNRVWAFFQENREDLAGAGSASSSVGEETPHRLEVKLHQTIKKVSDDIGKKFHLNTAISSIMELFNQMKKDVDELKKTDSGKALLKECLEKMVMLLSPFAPHICEEIWEGLGHGMLLSRTAWPRFDPELAKEETFSIVVQVNGKLRDKFEAERDLDEEKIRDTALGLSRIQKIIEGKEVKKVITIKNKLVNIVV